MKYILSIILLFYCVSIAGSKDLSNFQNKYIKGSLFSDMINISVTLPVSNKPSLRLLHRCWKSGDTRPFAFLRAKNVNTLEEQYGKPIHLITQKEQEDANLQMFNFFWKNLIGSLNMSYHINSGCDKNWDCKEFTYNVSSKGYAQRWYETNDLLDYDEKNLYFTLENNIHNVNFSNLQIYSYIKEKGEKNDLWHSAMPIFDVNNTSTKYKIHDFIPEPLENFDFTGDLPKKIYIDNNNFKKITTYFIADDITLDSYSIHSGGSSSGYQKHVLTSPTPGKSLPDMTTAQIIECLSN